MMDREKELARKREISRKYDAIHRAHIRRGICKRCGKEANIPWLGGGLCEDCVIKKNVRELHAQIDMVQQMQKNK